MSYLAKMMHDGLMSLSKAQQRQMSDLIDQLTDTMVSVRERMQGDVKRAMNIETRQAIPAALYIMTMASLGAASILGQAVGYEREQWLKLAAKAFDGYSIEAVAVDQPMGKRGKA